MQCKLEWDGIGSHCMYVQCYLEEVSQNAYSHAGMSAQVVVCTHSSEWAFVFSGFQAWPHEMTR